MTFCTFKKFLLDYPEALCLDGSRPAYYIREGSGAGITKWHIHIQGYSELEEITIFLHLLNRRRVVLYF
jgi:hypothetical protein